MSSRIRHSSFCNPLIVPRLTDARFIIGVSQGYATTRNTPLTTPNASPVKPVPTNPQNTPTSTPSIFRTTQDDLREVFSAAGDGAPIITPLTFSPSPLKRARVEDSDEEGKADAPIGPVDINTAAPVRQYVLNAVDVRVLDEDRATRPLPRKFKRAAAAPIPGLKNLGAAATPVILDENREVNPFASTS